MPRLTQSLPLSDLRGIYRKRLGRLRTARSAANPAAEFVFDMDPDDVLK